MTPKHIFGVSLAATVFSFLAVPAQAGQFLLSDAGSPGNFFLTGSGAATIRQSCNGGTIFAGTYDLCAGNYLNFASGATSVTVFQGDSANPITYSNSSNGALETVYFSDTSSPPQITDQLSLGWSGTNVIGFSLFSNDANTWYNGFDPSCANAGGCLAVVTGLPQVAYTLQWKDSSNEVIATDTIALQAQVQGTGTPEPATALLVIPGLAMAAYRRRRR